MKNTITIFDLVIYHDRCADGFTAAWVFWNSNKTKNTEYLSYTYTQKPPSLDYLENKCVAIVDFSFSREYILQAIQHTKYLVVLDHHISAERELGDLKLGDKGLVIFDMKRSGAQIAWDYLNPGMNRPFFIDYVADRDLWKFELPNSKEINEALNTFKYFTSFEMLDSLRTTKYKDFMMSRLKQQGHILLVAKKEEVFSFVLLSKMCEILVNGICYNARVVVCPKRHASEVGHEICNTYPSIDFAAMCWPELKKEGEKTNQDRIDFTHRIEWGVSLRTNKDTIDLSVIAKTYGGGGHKKAAAFTIRENSRLFDYFIF